MRRILLIVPFLVSAGPADDLTRRGLHALSVGDGAAAESLLAAAADTTADPGLVAFDRGCAAFARGDLRGAEVFFTQSLDDAAILPARQARAFYNRGLCRMLRGTDPATLRAAVVDFGRATTDPDPAFVADAKHNLELAKLLWAQARAKKGQPPLPSDPDDLPPPRTVPPTADPSGGDPAPGGSPMAAAPGTKDDGQTTKSDGQKSPGTGPLPVISDGPAAQPLSPADAREHLRRAGDRMDRDRATAARLGVGPDRPKVPDW